MAVRKNITINASETDPVVLHNVGEYSEVRITAPYTIEDAYVRCVRVDCGRGTGTAYFEIRSADAADHICNGESVQFAYDRAASADEAMTQAYTAAKAGPYAEATDC